VKKHKQFIPIRPLVKERPRATRTGHVYTPKRTENYEKAVAAAYNGPLFDASHTIEVSLVINSKGTTITVSATENPDFKSPLKGDVDNYAKSILDGLNGVAWEDDKQIIKLTVRKHDES